MSSYLSMAFAKCKLNSTDRSEKQQTARNESSRDAAMKANNATIKDGNGSTIRHLDVSKRSADAIVDVHRSVMVRSRAKVRKFSDRHPGAGKKKKTRRNGEINHSCARPRAYGSPVRHTNWLFPAPDFNIDGDRSSAPVYPPRRTLVDHSRKNNNNNSKQKRQTR